MKDPHAFDFDADYGDIYDRIANTVIPGYRQLFEATLALLKVRLGGVARVLVVGSGTGREIETFTTAEPGWTALGADPSARMIEAARALTLRLGVDDRVTLFQGTVSALPDEPSFDAATVLNVLHFLPDDGAKDELMQAVAARMRPGAPVALFDLHGDPTTEGFATLEAGWTEFMRLRGLEGEELSGFQSRLRDGIVYVPERRLLEICRQAGFRVECRYFGGFHYGGWLLERVTSGAETSTS